MPIAENYVSKQETPAMGGTELMVNELVKRMNARDPKLLDNFQIFVSRIGEEFDPSKLNVFYLHDVPEDHQAANELKDGLWKRFDILIFVSNQQMHEYVKKFDIPYSKCIVMYNCIEPIEVDAQKDFKKDKINFVYASSPQRGLNVLTATFKKLAEKYSNIHLDVFSSFQLYGWPENDEGFEQLYEEIKQHPQMTYHGAVSNDVVRETMAQSQIFAYPSTWRETACRTLMEAMSSKMVCIHPDYGALFNTAGGLTRMYPFNDNLNEHALILYHIVDDTIQFIQNNDNEKINDILNFQKAYADLRFNWNSREAEWFNLFQSMLAKKDIIMSEREASAQQYLVIDY